MKKLTTILAIVGAIAIIFLALYGLAQFNNPVSNALGGGQTTVNQTLAGSADDLITAPTTYSESASTSTAGTTTDGGNWTQQIGTDGITQFTLSGQAIGGTATSSLLVKTQISIDGTTFFNITGNSTSTDEVATTTVPVVGNVISIDPGTATTSFATIVNIPPSKYMRLLFMGEDLSTDPNDGVQAFIQIGLNAGY